MQISTSVPLPLTTVEIVDLEVEGVDLDSACICDHMPDPNRLFGNKAAILLGALVRYIMQNQLFIVQGKYPMSTCESNFKLRRAEFK